MARVWDGSEGEVANGYWTCNVMGAEVDEIALTPVYSRLFSQASPDFRFYTLVNGYSGIAF